MDYLLRTNYEMLKGWNIDNVTNEWNKKIIDNNSDINKTNEGVHVNLQVLKLCCIA